MRDLGYLDIVRDEANLFVTLLPGSSSRDTTCVTDVVAAASPVVRCYFCGWRVATSEECYRGAHDAMLQNQVRNLHKTKRSGINQVFGGSTH